ncbi:hypothetical protein Tco_0773035 [Tanacetum coccineum]|uniref:Uncharacterized protein n=1 Tax=Tanacetum coccineum TaxID=301880 RepID=A0ABQ4ZJK4_9ASTR
MGRTKKTNPLNSLSSAASYTLFETKVEEGGSLAKSFSVVEGKYNLPDLVANCLKSSKNDHKFLVSSQVILSKSLYALSCSSVEPRYGSSSRINCLT